MTLRVFIRPGCTGMGSCTRLAPAVFRMDPDRGTPHVLMADASAHREAVQLAADSCPFVGVESDGATRSEEFAPATVVRVQRLTPNVVELRLSHRGFRFIPGQYAFVRFHEEAADGLSGSEFFRPYSIVHADGAEVAFCVRVLTNGRGGRMLTRLKAGDGVGLSRAAGRFTLRSTDQAKLFITGGTGIAPVLPMLRAAPDAAKTVVIGGRTEHDFVYLAELRTIPNTELILVAHQHGESWDGRGGTVPQTIDELELDRYREFYTSGSPALVSTVRERLVKRGIASDRIFCDAFEPGGTASGMRSGPDPRQARDWPGRLRRLHAIASLGLAAVFLFYAASGFVANRAAWFSAEDTPVERPMAHVVPADLALTPSAVAPFLAGMLPPGAVPMGCTVDDEHLDADYARGEDRFHLRIDCATRAVSLIQSRSLPAELAIERTALVAWLRQQISGEPDEKNLEDEDDRLAVDFESVWGTHQVVVDKAEHSYSVNTIRQAPLVSLIDLHRSKHAGAWQRIVVDATALTLAGLVLSGVAMGLLTRMRARRRLTMFLAGGSVVLLISLLIAR